MNRRPDPSGLFRVHADPHVQPFTAEINGCRFPFHPLRPVLMDQPTWKALQEDPSPEVPDAKALARQAEKIRRMVELDELKVNGVARPKVFPDRKAKRHVEEVETDPSEAFPLDEMRAPNPSKSKAVK